MSPGNATAIEPGKPQNPTTNKPPKPNSNSQDAECFNALKLHPRLIPSFLNNPCGLIDFLIRKLVDVVGPRLALTLTLTVLIRSI